MELAIETINDVMVVKATGKLDAVTSPEFLKQLNVYILDVEPDIIIDLSGLNYISSAGLRTMLELRKKYNAMKKKLYICGMMKTVSQVFEISGLHILFDIFATLDDALEKIAE